MTAKSSDAVPHVPLIDSLKGIVAWIGGAVAGLSVLFYAAGYLAYRAHTNMLGLTGVIEFPHEQLLYEGAKFFITAGAYLLNGLFVVGIAVLLLLILLAVLRQIGPVARALNALKARRDGLRATHPRLIDIGALVLLTALFLYHSEKFYYPLQDVYPHIERLAYQAPGSAQGCSPAVAGNDSVRDTVSQWLQQGEQCRLSLLATFRGLLAGYLLLLLAVGYFAFRKPAGQGVLLQRIAVGTLIAYAVLYTVLLPMAFGVLVRAPVYPVITLKAKGEAAVAAPRLLLLNKKDDELLVWDASARKAVWMPADDSTEIHVTGQANLFALPAAKEAKP